MCDQQIIPLMVSIIDGSFSLGKIKPLLAATIIRFRGSVT
jgi:hypothetical protein